MDQCAVCGVLTESRCSSCNAVSYCSREHQISDWKANHKNKCKSYEVITQISMLVWVCVWSLKEKNLNLINRISFAKINKDQAERETRSLHDCETWHFGWWSDFSRKAVTAWAESLVTGHMSGMSSTYHNTIEDRWLLQMFQVHMANVRRRVWETRVSWGWMSCDERAQVQVNCELFSSECGTHSDMLHRHHAAAIHFDEKERSEEVSQVEERLSSFNEF